ncbi:MAG: bifunctional riboflavin kinase/FAD synthetase, partial [Betaproteobacteria bacterium]|nr:bifunctional riboflavin kinase/FAD synthetase [Betaproteobacteria bacterium]
PTLNLAFGHARPAAQGIFVARVHGLAADPQRAVVSFGRRPSVDDSGRVLLEAHVLDWSGNAYGKLVRVELLHKLRDEARYDGLQALTAAIDADVRAARAWFAREHDAASSSAGVAPGDASALGRGGSGRADPGGRC